MILYSKSLPSTNNFAILDSVEVKGISFLDSIIFIGAHCHTPEDTVDKIDFDKTARVVAGLDEAFKIIAN